MKIANAFVAQDIMPWNYPKSRIRDKTVAINHNLRRGYSMRASLHKISFIILLVFLFGCSTTHNHYGSKSGAYTDIGDVYLGLDVEIQNNFSDFAGKRIGLITNQTGLNREGLADIDIRLQRLFKC
jgi:hypothetical protein